MIRKILFAASAIIAGAVPYLAMAEVAITVPTSTGSSLTAQAAAQFADPGTLTLVVIAAGVPLFFYVVGRLIGLLPKGRGGRR